jgi:4-hydroxybenzoate polyprenyltransferase
MKIFIAIIKIIRPHQWLKNLMLFFPPFLSGGFLPAAIISHGLIPFLAFCSASSANYILNDLFDCSKDSAHPTKCNRPLPSGQVKTPVAAVLCGFFTVLAVVLSLQVSKIFLLYVGIYLGLSAAYSALLKQMPIVDVFCIAFGFVLRLYGGGEAFGVQISDWLFLTVFLLATFLSFGKRYSERRQLGDNAGAHRRTLEEYPDDFLEGALYLSGSTVLVTYAMYAISKPVMVYTVPLCTFGLLRYMMRIKSGQGGDPTDALLSDIPLLITGILWTMLVGWCVYS